MIERLAKARLHQNIYGLINTLGTAEGFPEADSDAGRVCPLPGVDPCLARRPPYPCSGLIPSLPGGDPGVLARG